MSLDRLEEQFAGETKRLGAVLERDETAKKLRISLNYLDRLRARGEGPKFVRLGHRVLYREQDVEDWFAAQVRDR